MIDGALPTIPGFTMQSVLGKGGQGRVYEALYKDMPVAIKLYDTDTEIGVKRVLLEVDAIRSLGSDCFPGIFCYGIDTVEGRECIWVAFEFIEGCTLKDLLSTRCLSDDAARSMMIAVSNAVSDLWSIRKRHRDIKPGNIMQKPDGTFILIDLGYAKHLDAEKLTETGWCLGTPGYIAPEEFSRRANATVKADVFSLGITSYECIYGVHPFQRKQRRVIDGRCLPVEPVKGISEELRRTIAEMLSHDPLDRPMPHEITGRLGGGR